MTLPAWLALGAVAIASVSTEAATTPRPAAPARARVDDAAVQQAMRDEIGRSMAELRLGDEARPYFLAYTVSDLDQATASATLGALTAQHAYRGRVLRTDLRVGGPSFDNTNFEGGAHVDSIPSEDDYAALRRELWLRTDEAYKGALETLARKRAAAAGQAAADDESTGDFSKEAAAKLELPPGARAPDPAGMGDVARRLSAIFIAYPQIQSSRVTATFATVRRRLATSEGTWIDDDQATVRVDVVADTQADDGMRLRSFVPFTAVDPSGLPPAADMERAVRAMAKELVAMRTAPVVSSGAGAVLFEGAAAAQLVKRLLADQIAGTPPPKTASASSDEQTDQSDLASKLGQKVAAPLLSAVDDPLLKLGPGKAPLYGAYRVDDEGVPAQRVSLIERGILKSLLMSRTPSKDIGRSNGHARAPRFAGARAHAGTLIVSGAREQPRTALLAALSRIAKGGGVTTYVVRLLDDDTVPSADADDLTSLLMFGSGMHGPPPIRPLVVYRVDGARLTLVRGALLENLMPRSLKDVTAIGNEPFVYNYLDGGGGFSGVPSTIIAPALLVGDVDIRRQTGKNRKPPIYSSPLVLPPAAAPSGARSPSLPRPPSAQ